MEDKKNLAKVFKVLGDENRLLILELLKGEERCACSLLETLNITQSTLSHHMKQLNDVGLIKTRKDGKWSYYSINREKWRELAEVIESFLKCSCLGEGR